MKNKKTQSTTNEKNPKLLTTRELCIFSMLAVLLYLSKELTAILPNTHLLAMFMASFTLVYRKKAIIIIYGYVLLNGLMAGFSVWWLPYLYIWLPIYLIFLKLPRKLNPLIYASICALHGYLFGTLYAPAQALLFGLNLEGTIAWIISGLPYDFLHGTSNLIICFLIPKITSLILKLENSHLS